MQKISLAQTYRTREFGPVKLDTIEDDGLYPVKGIYYDMEYKELKCGSWTLDGAFDIDAPNAPEDLVCIPPLVSLCDADTSAMPQPKIA